MKNIFSFVIIFLTMIVMMQLSCSKDIHGRTDNAPALSPSNIDLEAGTWRTILLSRPDSFAVVKPDSPNTARYISELNEIKGLQQSLNNDQRDAIKYWSAGSVLRWNEILRSLVAKHNLPPYQNEDGTYPIPNAVNPFNYPQFPFSNPPYAARAYAYVSAAQYDALVACWYYKKLFNRPTPYNIDSTINANTTLITKTDLPSYPSEAAVLAGVTAEMMKLLFPTEIAYLEQKRTEAENAAIASGANVRSDIVAGEALGRQIAQVFIARGKTDNAGKAGGTPDQWAKLETDCIANGEIPWYSHETPKRPPMLPFFGNVKPFLFDSLSTIALRSGPPPLTASDQMKKETQEVLDNVSNISPDHIRIIQFWADGAGTYTPAGHWNAIAAEDFITKNFSEIRWARNMALLNMAEMDAAIVCWNTKYYYYNPRPCQMNPAIKTLTGLPNFPSYISGHSTFSAAAAIILGHIIPERADAYNAMAQEAALSRLYAGIHYRSDCDTGMVTGSKVGAYAVQRAMADGAE